MTNILAVYLSDMMLIQYHDVIQNVLMWACKNRACEHNNNYIILPSIFNDSQVTTFISLKHQVCLWVHVAMPYSLCVNDMC